MLLQYDDFDCPINPIAFIDSHGYVNRNDDVFAPGMPVMSENQTIGYISHVNTDNTLGIILKDAGYQLTVNIDENIH